MALTFSAGQVPTPDELNALLPVEVHKTSSTSRNTTTTIDDDPDLTVTLGPGTWRVEFVGRVTGATGGDFKCAWETSGVTFLNMRACVGPTSGTTDATATSMRASHHNLTTEVTYGTDGSANSIIRETLLFTVATAATLTLQWAQGTSSGTNTILGSGSHIVAKQVA